MSARSMMRKRGREGYHCNNRHCPSGADADMDWYTQRSQRTKEKREWRRDWLGQT